MRFAEDAQVKILTTLRLTKFGHQCLALRRQYCSTIVREFFEAGLVRLVRGREESKQTKGFLRRFDRHPCFLSTGSNSEKKSYLAATRAKPPLMFMNGQVSVE